MIQQRCFDKTEELGINDNVNDTFLATKFRGFIDVKAMNLAFSRLCRRHPMLCSRIRRNDGGYVLAHSAEYKPEFHVRDANFDDILARFGEPPRFCRSEYGFDKNLGRAILVQNSGEGYMILGVHHLLYAGAGAAELPRQLWEIYTRIVEGDTVNEPMGTLPPPPSQVLLERGFSLNSENVGSSKGLAESPSGSGPIAYSQSQYIQLSEEETAEILRAAKHNKVSVGGFMLGSLAIALKHVDKEIDSELLNVRTIMDMGRYVDPPVTALDSTYFGTLLTIPVLISENVTDVGVDFERKVKQRMKDRSNLHPMGDAYCRSSSSSLQPEVNFNNAGRIAKYLTPKGIEIDNIYRPGGMKSTSPMVRTVAMRSNNRAHVAILTYDSKMTLVLGGAIDIFEDLMRGMSIQIGRYGVSISELKEYGS